MILKKFRRCYYFSIIGYSLSAVSLLGIPLSDFEGNFFEKIIPYFVAVVFWAGLITGTVFFINANGYCKRIEKKLKKNNFLTYRPRMGIISFFSNKEAGIFDCIFIISALAVIIMAIVDIQNEWLTIICLICMFLSFLLHSFFNGKNYLYIKAYEKFLNQKERKENE